MSVFQGVRISSVLINTHAQIFDNECSGAPLLEVLIILSSLLCSTSPPAKHDTPQDQLTGLPHSATGECPLLRNQQPGLHDVVKLQGPLRAVQHAAVQQPGDGDQGTQ